MSSNKVSPVLRWLFPSVKDIFFLGYLLIPYLLTRSSALHDSDTGWHIRNGEHILQSWTFPRTDYFSYTQYGKPWFAWEWLSDVFMATVHRLAGLNGIETWAHLTFAVTLTLLFVWMTRRGGNLLIIVLGSGLAGFAASVHWLARPHLFTMLFLLIWYMCLEQIQSRGIRGLAVSKHFWWILPLLILLWTNLHGGFVAGLIMLCIYALGNLLSSWTCQDEETKRQARKLAWRFFRLALICLLVTAINPYGFAMHQHILDSYFHSQYLMDSIQEFVSPNFHWPMTKFFEIILLGSLVLLGVGYRRLSFIEVGLLLFWTYMALFSVRHIPLYCLVVIPIVVSHFSDYCAQIEAGPKVANWVRQWMGRFNRCAANFFQMEATFNGCLYALLGALIMIGVSLNHGYLFNLKVQKADFDPQQFPVKAAQYLEAHSIPGHVFTIDQWAGYLIYRFYPRYPVFFDGRSDMYGEAFVKKYQMVTGLEYKWKEVLEEYHVDWFLLPVNQSLATALKESPHWQVIYDDHVAVIFIKR